MKPKNIDEPPKHITHSSLERSSDHFYHRRCPVCDDGILLVRRGDDLKLREWDVCIGCGQRFIYDDIEQLRKVDGM